VTVERPRPRLTQRRSLCGFGGYLHTDLLFQIELGTAVGKLFRCSVMTVIDVGDSDILAEQS